MREYVEVVHGLLRGETVEASLEGRRNKVRFLNPEEELINLENPVPLHISALGPKGRAMAAEIADGWLTITGAVSSAVEQLENVSASCGEGGRDPASLYKTVVMLGCVLADGEAPDSPRARAQAGPLVTTVLHALTEGSIPEYMTDELRGLAEEYRALYETFEPADARYLRMHHGHLMRVHPDEERFLAPELMRMASFTGTADELRRGLEALEEAGAQQFAIQLVPGQEKAMEEWMRVAELVSA